MGESAFISNPAGDCGLGGKFKPLHPHLSTFFVWRINASTTGPDLITNRLLKAPHSGSRWYPKVDSRYFKINVYNNGLISETVYQLPTTDLFEYPSVSRGQYASISLSLLIICCADGRKTRGCLFQSTLVTFGTQDPNTKGYKKLLLQIEIQRLTRNSFISIAKSVNGPDQRIFDTL